MPVKRIRKTDVEAWLRELAKGGPQTRFIGFGVPCRVYVPTARHAHDVVLAPLDEGKWTLDFGRLTESPKRLLFPQMDRTLTWEGTHAEPVTDDTPRVLFGLRACDAAAVAVLDEFFRRNFLDPHYAARRSRAWLIVLACETSVEGCFCRRTGTGPVLTEGFDVQLFADGDGYIAESGTSAGEKLLAAGGKLFSEAPPDWKKRREVLAEKAAAAQPEIDFARAAEIIRKHQEPDGFWESVARRCLVCGGCAYLCPTCTCFTFFDRPEPAARGASRGHRLRMWDSCVLEGFTREASGYNPRPRASMRCSRRYEHKLTGSELATFPFRCVGCGRCVATCLSRMGMIEVVRELLEKQKGTRDVRTDRKR